MRRATVTRKTIETDVTVSLDLDGTGRATIATGIGFFDHMLDQLARHSAIDLEVRADGDLHIDMHHTVEDVGIALGRALREAAGDLRGVTRFADAHQAMDETLTRVVVDFSGRAFLVFQAPFRTERIGAFDVQLVREFFQAFAANAGITLHIANLYGENDHHIAESCFKGVARVLRQALTIDSRRSDEAPSTKGSLGG
jgi:imidazoleglycerol-phosphate dehydratase